MPNNSLDKPSKIINSNGQNNFISSKIDKDKIFSTDKENKNSFRVSHLDTPCLESGLTNPYGEHSSNPNPDTSGPLLPEQMGALNTQIDNSFPPSTTDVQGMSDSIQKQQELQKKFDDINASYDKAKQELDATQNPSTANAFSTLATKNTVQKSKDSSKDKNSEQHSFECKKDNFLDCKFKNKEQKIAFLTSLIKKFEAQLAQLKLDINNEIQIQASLFTKIDSYRASIVSMGKNLREAARALNGTLYPRVLVYDTSDHNKRMELFELFFSSSQIDFQHFVNDKNTYELSKAASVLGREFFIYDDLIYLYIRGELNNSDKTKYNIIELVKKYANQIDLHIKQYKQSNLALVQYINDLRSQLNSQGFRVQAESQALADYTAATSFEVCLDPSPKPTPTPVPTPTPRNPKDPIYPDPNEPDQNCPSKSKSNSSLGGFDAGYTVVGVYDFDPGPNREDLTVVVRPNDPNSHLQGFLPQKAKVVGERNDPLLGKVTDIVSTVDVQSNATAYIDGTTNNLVKKTPQNSDGIINDAVTTDIKIQTRDKNTIRPLSDIANDSNLTSIEKKIIQDLDENTKNALPSADSPRIPAKNNKTINKIDSTGQALDETPSTNNNVKKYESCCIDRKVNRNENPSAFLAVIAVDLDKVYESMKVGEQKTLVLESKDKSSKIKMTLTKKAPNGNNSVWDVDCAQ